MATETTFSVEHVKDYETGELFTIERDIDYSRAIRAFNDAECQHPTTAPMRVRVLNGNVQVRTCCTNCGRRIGTPLPQKNRAWVDGLPWQPDEHAESYTTRRATERHAILLALGRRQHAERGRFTHGYNAYMASPEWSAKRALVMKRCGGTCEGCGIAPATEVHHQSYDNFRNEFLFELLGLCHPCHDRITLKKRERSGLPIEGADDSDYFDTVARTQ